RGANGLWLPSRWTGLAILPDCPLELDNLTSSLHFGPDAGDRRMVDAQLLAHPAVRPIRRLPKLVGDKLALLLLGQLPPRQVQRPRQRPFLVLTEALLGDRGEVVADIVSDRLAVSVV